MLIDNQIFVYDFAWSISDSIASIAPFLHDDHKKVPSISARVTQAMDLSSGICEIACDSSRSAL